MFHSSGTHIANGEAPTGNFRCQRLVHEGGNNLIISVPAGLGGEVLTDHFFCTSVTAP